MGDEHDGALILGNGLQNLLTGSGVEVVGGLVEQQHVGSRGDQRGQSQTGLLTAGKHVSRFHRVVTGEQERAENRTGLRVIELGRHMLQVLQHGGVQIQGVVLLREVADLAAVTVFHGTGVRLLDVGQQAQRGGLAGAVVAEDHHTRALVDGQVHAGEHDVGTVGLGNILGHDRRAAAGRGLGETDVRHLLGLLRLGGVFQQLFGTAHHVLRRHGLGGLGVQSNALLHETVGLLLGHFAFAAAALLVHHALVQVGLPAKRIHVDLAELRVQMPDLVHHFVQQFGGVGDDQEAALVLLQVAAQPFDGIGIQVVGRLVEDQGVGIGEQDARQLDAAALATGERAELLLHDLLRQAERGGHGDRLGLGRVAAGLVEVLHGLVVPGHGLAHHVRIRVGHILFGLADAVDDGGDVARAHHAVERGLRGIGGVRVLRQVAELAGDAHLAGGGQHVAGDHAGQRGLAGAVAAHQTDLVSLGHMEVGGVKQRARADLNFKSLHLNGHE